MMVPWSEKATSSAINYVPVPLLWSLPEHQISFYDSPLHVLLTARRGWTGDKSAKLTRAIHEGEQGHRRSGIPPGTRLNRGKIISLPMCTAEHLPSLMKQWLICNKSPILTFLALERFNSKVNPALHQVYSPDFISSAKMSIAV